LTAQSDPKQYNVHLLFQQAVSGRMETPNAFRPIEAAGFDVQFLSHAGAILQVDFPDALEELAKVLLAIQIPIEELIGSGGGETKGTQRLRRALAKHSWHKLNFTIEKIVNGVPRESISHEVDHVRTITAKNGVHSTLALEIEWNNKDPFFDRDLENFKRLHSEAAISAGLIVTRGLSLQADIKSLVFRLATENGIRNFDDLAARDVLPTAKQKALIQRQVTRTRKPKEFVQAWTDKFVSDKFGTATTHWSKLMERIGRGVGSPCPLVLVGIPSSMITFGEDPEIVKKLIEEGAPKDADEEIEE
jgi:hypothetical protein